jgi:hypothetical protein
LEFKGIEGNDAPKEMCSKMELMNIPGIVGQLDGIKPNVLKLIQPTTFSHIRVKAKTAQLPVAALK